MVGEPGIYVAFDRFGQHYEYARHPDSKVCANRQNEQRKKVASLQEKARLHQGRVALLSLTEFDAMVLAGINYLNLRHRMPEKAE